MRSRLCFALVALAIGWVPASADPLQDFAQCAQISSSELRLICYDAAARGLGALPVATAPSPSAEAAASAPPSPAPVKEAGQAPVPKASKGWMFGLFGGSKKETQVAAAPGATAAPATAEADFGASRLPKTESAADKGVSSIRSAITDYAYTPLGRIIVFLENGQVWRQIDGDSKKLRLRKRETYTAEVAKGVLGSFNLSVDGVDGMVKVTRIK